jgi:pilin isopeptide linkage protein
VLVDGEIAGGEFEFGLFDEAGNLISTAKNGGIVWWCMSVAQFEEQSYETPGVYNYTIRELTPSGNGYITDSSVYHVRVTITAEDIAQGGYGRVEYLDGEDAYNCPTSLRGAVPAPRDGPNGPVFVNYYGGGPGPGPSPCGDATIVGQKRAVCGCLQDGQFSFVLRDEAGNEIARTQNNAYGNIQFSLTPAQAGHFCYTMAELPSNDCCWSFDERRFKVCLDVSAVGNGEYATAVSYPDGIPEFVNRYNCRPPRRPVCCCNPCCPPSRWPACRSSGNCNCR